MSFALARSTGGSFSVEARPQDPAFFDSASEAWAAPRAAEIIAARIGERFGVSVLWSGRTMLPIASYRPSACEEAEAAPALREVESVLSQYPPGFFRRVESVLGGLVIELCGPIRSKDDMPDSPGAVSVDCLSFRLIAIDVKSGALGPSLMHELCHVADACLDRLAKEDPTHWNDAVWASLNPPGYSYYMAYSDPSGQPYAVAASAEYTAEPPNPPDEVYFINRYSKTFPTEDRAVAFEMLMRLSSADCLKSPHIRAKLTYYFAALRRYLDPEEEWQGPTFWETRLGQVKAQG